MNKSNSGQNTFETALSLHQAGHFEQAKAIYLALLQRAPAAPIHHALGVLYFQQAQFDMAENQLHQAIQSNASVPLYHMDLGRIYLKNNNHQQALKSYLNALKIEPNSVSILTEAATLSFNLGVTEKAEQLFTAAAKANPNNTFIRKCLAKCKTELFKFEEAKHIYKKILKNDDKDAACLENLVILNRIKGREDEAERMLRSHLAKDPSNLDIKLALAKLLNLQEKHDDAEKHLKEILDRQPNNIAALLQLHTALIGKDPAESERALEKAYKLDSSQPATLTTKASFLIQMWGDFVAAETLYKKANAIQRNTKSISAWLFTCNYRDDLIPSEVHKRHLDGGKSFYINHANNAPTPTRKDRKLVIGYISPDLHAHSVSYFIEPILIKHDRNRFKVICYSDSTKYDQVNARLRKISDSWVDIAGVSDQAVHNRIIKDEVDILIDLAGHTADNRLNVLATGAAPVQISYLGYCNTTGIPNIHYRISDAIADPKGTSESINSEQILRLASGFLCYQPPLNAPPVNRLPALEKGGITFGSFNALPKISNSTLTLWSQLLSSIPASKLVIKAKGLDNENFKSIFMERCQKAGIDANRLELRGRTTETLDHLTVYNDIDIALDPFPYNGTTTTCEALWMGVPVLSIRGDRHSSRVGSSLLHFTGLDELIAESGDDLICKAKEFSKDLNSLALLRASLREKMRNSTLMDATQTCRELEQHYVTTWNKCAL